MLKMVLNDMELVCIDNEVKATQPCLGRLGHLKVIGCYVIQDRNNMNHIFGDTLQYPSGIRNVYFLVFDRPKLNQYSGLSELASVPHLCVCVCLLLAVSLL